ncbi:hypothetical protein, partial [Actinoplanes sp. NPDC020271]|uniref:hypothetical protein n=1 Tax=Actinoplanes sp. NPDC020271 TaxID=3363896 RepID=UPI00379502B6
MWSIGKVTDIRTVLLSAVSLVVAGVWLVPGAWWRWAGAATAAVGWRWVPVVLAVAGVGGLRRVVRRRPVRPARARRRPIAERVPLSVHVIALVVAAAGVAAGAGYVLWTLLGRAGAGVWTVQYTFDAIKIVLTAV